ncbi:MAG: hypothetical protein KF819_24825 [Labilithrix sp.]|nr:hypothetical protein [Labilithrix sp.]
MARRALVTTLGAGAALVCAAIANACTSFAESAEPVPEADAAAGADAATACAPSALLLACNTFDDPSPVGPLSFFTRQDGEATVEVSRARASSPPASLRVAVGSGGGRGQVAAAFTTTRTKLTATMKVFVGAPTTTPVRLMVIESSDGARRLSLVLTGVALALAVDRPGDGGTTTDIKPSTLAIGPGGWSDVHLEVEQLDSSSPNYYLGSTDRGKRITGLPGIKDAQIIAFGAETSAPAGAAEIFIDDVVILER